MSDAHLDPVIDLSPATLIRACKGDVRKLPKFVVHDNDAWPWVNKVRPAKGVIHIRRSTFLAVVVPQVPVKPGLWVRVDAQEFSIDLKPHQLQGSDAPLAAPPDVKNHDTARRVAKADSVGRLPDEEDYGTEALERSERRQIDRDDLERLARDPSRGSVESAVLSGGDTEGGVAMGSDD